LLSLKPETSEEAKEAARRYWRKLCKWHGHDEVTELFGHPVDRVKAMSQVEIFSDSENEGGAGIVSTLPYMP
jgi:hypothetical protein